MRKTLDYIKELMVVTVILRSPNLTKVIEISYDVSIVSISNVLSQQGTPMMNLNESLFQQIKVHNL